MTKNMTQKGLALGAASALLISGFVALPASAAGLADKSFVSLTPTLGTEYTVLADNLFDISANAAATISAAGNIKFLVEDTTAALKFDVDVNGATAQVDGTYAITNGLGQVTTAAGGIATITNAAAAVTVTTTAVHGLTTGDSVIIAGLTDADGPDAAFLNIAAMVTVTSTTVFTYTAGGTATNDNTVVAPGSISLVARPTVVGAGNVGFTFFDTTAHSFVVGDLITGAAFANALLNVATLAVTAVTANSFTVTGANAGAAALVDDTTNANSLTRNQAGQLVSRARMLQFTDTIGALGVIGTGPVVQSAQFAAPVGGRKSATDGTFVVDTNVASSVNDKVLRLANTGLTTVAVVITAWVDSNDNGLIDTTEYTSEERTVTFKARSEITATATTSPVIGDAAFTASIATTPTLNGNQVALADLNWLNAQFTRQGNAASLFALATAGAGGNTTAVWNDTTKIWTVFTLMDADITGAGTTSNDGAATGTGWATLTAPIAADSTTVSVSTTGLVTVTTANAAHSLATGDLITMATADAAIALAAEAGNRSVTVLSATTFSYQVSETTGFPATTATVGGVAGGTEYTVTTYAGQGLVDRVFAGAYTVRPIIETVNGAAAGDASRAFAGPASSQGTIAVTSTQATFATVASTGVAGVSAVRNAATADAANTAAILVGTTTVPMTLVARDVNNVVVSANRPVVITAQALFGGAASVGTFLINGQASPVTLRTDAAGQVAFNVTTTTTTAAAQTRIQAVVEGQAAVTVGIDLTWNAIAFGMTDLSVTNGQFAPATNAAVARTVTSGGSYTMSLLVSDQFFTAGASDTYRLQVTGQGVVNQNVVLVDGKADVVITDSGLNAVGANFVSTIQLQLATAGVFANTTSLLTVTSTVVAVPTLTMATVGQTQLSPFANAAVLSNPVAAVALVERDTRTDSIAAPAYLNNNVISGSVLSSVTSVAQVGSVVTVTGPTSMLFQNNTVSALGSIKFVTNANGLFEVNVFSTTAQTATVVTVTVDGVSKTVALTFTGIGIGQGTALAVTMPAAVKPASSFQVKASLKDVYGNAVVSAAAAIRVVYTGPGLVFGQLPTATDANGEVSFSVLLGSNDTGAIAVTVEYDQNGDGDFVDTLDLKASGSTAITASGEAAEAASSTDTVVNVGSFSGKLVVYANKASGSKISYKIAGKWVVENPTSDTLQRYDRVVGAIGATVLVDIYVDGVKKLSKSVVTK